MCYSDDPIADFLKWDEEQERRLERYPRCIECGNRITDDCCYLINGDYICEDCMNGNYRVFVDDIIDE